MTARNRIGLVTGLAAGTLALGLPLAAAPAMASTPTSSTVTAPASGSTSPAQAWTGSIPTGSEPQSVCAATDPQDTHQVVYTAPGDPSTTSTTLRISITWTPASGNAMTNDEILTVLDSSGTAVASSDTSDTTETVTLVNPASGTYKAVACGYVNASAQPYTGSASAQSVAVRHAPPPVSEAGAAGADPVVPEVPFAVGLPVAALLAGGAVYVVRRRRRTV